MILNYYQFIEDVLLKYVFFKYSSILYFEYSGQFHFLLSLQTFVKKKIYFWSIYFQKHDTSYFIFNFQQTLTRIWERYIWKLIVEVKQDVV